MSFSKKGRALYVKPETTAGTWSDPLDRTNNYLNPTLPKVRLTELSFDPQVEVNDENFKIIDGTAVGYQSTPGKSTASASYSILLAPGEFEKDAADTANVHGLNYLDYLENSGLRSVLITDPLVTPDTYSYAQQYLLFPSIFDQKTFSQTVVDKDLEDSTGAAFDMIGTINNLTISAESSAAPITMAFDTSGGVEDYYEILPADMAKIKFDIAEVMETSFTRFINTTIRITDLETNAVIETCYKKFELQTGNQLQNIECQAGESGIKKTVISGQQPRLMLSPELQKPSEFNFYDAMRERKLYKIEIIANDKNKADGSDFEPYRIVIPYAELLTGAISEDGDVLYNDITFRPLGNINKDVPTVQYAADADGTLTDFDFTGSDLEGNEYEATFFLIISEEYTKDI